MRAVNFGEYFRYLRVEAGMSQRDIEQEAGLPDNIISTWETGNLDPAYYFDRALNVLGYELQIIGKGGNNHGE
mgnify:CR=1 FL=1